MTRRVVRIAELADENGWVVNQTFEDCDIAGPAVLVPNACTFEHNSFPGPFERFLWPLPPRPVFGPVGLRNCAFRRCRFSHTVGIAGSQDLIQKFAEDFLR